MGGLKHQDITSKIIAAFYKVYKTLGYGFLENVYQNALAIEFTKEKLKYVAQAPIEVYYDSKKAGKYYADFIVENAVIVEIKATSILIEEHEAQLLNYLKATKFEVGLLLNFGRKLQFCRKIYDNDKKGSLLWLKK